MSADALDQIRDAMRGCNWRLEARLVFGGPSSIAVQVLRNEGATRAKWVKVGPMIFPPDDGTVGDVLRMLSHLSIDPAEASRS